MCREVDKKKWFAFGQCHASNRSSASITPMQLSDEAISFMTAITEIGFDPRLESEARRRSSASGAECGTMSHLLRGTTNGVLGFLAIALETLISISSPGEMRERMWRGGMISDGDRNTHDLALGCWMAVRRISRSRTSVDDCDEGAEAVGIWSSGTSMSREMIRCSGGRCKVKGGVNGVLAISSHGRETDDVGESHVPIDMSIDGVVNGVAAAAAPMAPPGWKPRKTSAGLFPVAVCNFRAVAIASASPRDKATVVDDVGALTPNDVSSSSCIGAGKSIPIPAGPCSARSGHASGCVCEVRAMTGTVTGRCGSNDKSSGERPEKDIKRIVSFWTHHNQYVSPQWLKN
jgi:hypothetical protein